MWINGLKLLRKPLLHLHTQHNRDIPWATIDMDFMNMNQAAHGDREHGFIMSRMRLNRKVVVGFWQDEAVQAKIGAWTRAAAAWHDWQGAKFCRFGDNMREVAVTEGRQGGGANSVWLLCQWLRRGRPGQSHQRSAGPRDVERWSRNMRRAYVVAPKLRKDEAMRDSLREAARIEAGSARVSGGRQFQGIHRHVRGFARLGAIARHGACSA